MLWSRSLQLGISSTWAMGTTEPSRLNADSLGSSTSPSSPWGALEVFLFVEKRFRLTCFFCFCVFFVCFLCLCCFLFVFLFLWKIDLSLKTLWASWKKNSIYGLQSILPGWQAREKVAAKHGATKRKTKYKKALPTPPRSAFGRLFADLKRLFKKNRKAAFRRSSLIRHKSRKSLQSARSNDSKVGGKEGKSPSVMKQRGPPKLKHRKECVSFSRGNKSSSFTTPRNEISKVLNLGRDQKPSKKKLIQFLNL